MMLIVSMQKRTWKNFEIKNLEEYHDLYVQNGASQQVHWNIWTCSSFFQSAPGLAWQACLKKTEVELELLADIDMLLMIEKGIRTGIYYAIHRYAAAHNDYMKNYDKDNELSYIMCLNANNLYGWALSQKVSVRSFNRIKKYVEIQWRVYKKLWWK